MKVFCTDPADLLQVVLAHRGLSMDNVDVHVGIDGGQNWLKLGLTVTERKETLNTGRACYAEVEFLYILHFLIYFYILEANLVTFEPVKISLIFKKVKWSEFNFLFIKNPYETIRSLLNEPGVF